MLFFLMLERYDLFLLGNIVLSFFMFFCLFLLRDRLEVKMLIVVDCDFVFLLLILEGCILIVFDKILLVEVDG